MDAMFSRGTFFTGCNYWASHAGTAMWSNWRPDVVEDDFRKLSEAEIRVLRVFPLWFDFQPISLLRKYAGHPVEYRWGEEPLSNDAEGWAGVSKTAMEHFAEFASLAGKYNMKLIIGLVTGWMSGRIFVPPALEGRNLLTDPVAIMWETRFVKYFVSRFMSTPAIVAWDLGNECNCLGELSSSEAAWVWSSNIANAIKSIDTSRPVVSGMHGLRPEGIWTIQDQAEITDILTTHPYPHFTPYCDQDAINTIRTGLHAVAETLLYRGIGDKQCFIEECGTLGPMFADDEAGADFIRNNLFTLWAHDCRGFLWWCANDHSSLVRAPYDWNSTERELGLFRPDGSPKPILSELSKFTRYVENFPCGTLPERIVDGVCILTRDQDTWGVAYSSFLLAKQAGLDIEFQYSKQPIRDAKLYLLPSLIGDASISRHRMFELLEKVKNGAVLYISIDTGLLSHFTELSGLRVLTREKHLDTDTVTIEVEGGKVELELQGTYQLNLEVINAEVIGRNQDGKPSFTCAKYGKGKVFFLNYPVETYLLGRPGVFHGKTAKPYHLLYRHLKNSIDTGKVVSAEFPNIGITEHILNDCTRVVVVINYETTAIVAELDIAVGWKVKELLYGDPIMYSDKPEKVSVCIKNNDAVVFTITSIP